MSPLLADRDVEIELLVAFVGLRLAQVPRRPGAAHHDAGETPAPGVLQRDDGDIDVALLEDAVADDELVEIVAHLEEGIAERLDVVDEIRRQILVHAAGPHVIGVHARAGGALVEHHQLLALLEAPERRRQGADVHRLRGDVEEMRKQAPDLGIEHADELTALRHLEPEQLLDGEAEGMLLVHRRDVIEPVEIRDRLQVGLGLDQLLGAAVEQPDMRIDALDDLAVELEHEAQDAVGGRVLRPEIDREVAELVLGHGLKYVILGRRKATRGPHHEDSALVVPRSSALRCTPAEDDARVSRSPRLPTADCPLPNPSLFHPPAARSPCLPRARENRSCGIPAAVLRAH